MAASCSRVPKHILSERKMRVILYDMLLAEAIVEVKNESFPSSTERQTVYDAVFAKHQISQADYDSALIWYGKHMDLYMAVYKLVLKDVNAAIAALGDVNPNPITGDASEQDSIDIWIFKRSEAFNPNRVFNTLTFDIMPQNPYPSGSSYVLGVSVWGISRSLKNKPVIHLNAVQADTIISISKEITGDGYYEASVGTLADKVVSRIYGYILLHDIDVAVHRIYLNDIRLMKYNQQPETPDDAPQ
jgi:hypothetical protein